MLACSVLLAAAAAARTEGKHTRTAAANRGFFRRRNVTYHDTRKIKATHEPARSIYRDTSFRTGELRG